MKEIYQMNKGELDEWLEKQDKSQKNQLIEEGRKSILRIFLEQFKDFLVIILIISAIVSAILGDVGSANVILFVITMNAILGTLQHKKAERSLDSLKELSAPMAKVMRGGEMYVIPSAEVRIGDVVHLEAGDFVPADGRILENASLRVNESALTGESQGVEKDEQVIVQEGVSLGDRLNMVYSGSFVNYGRGSFLVTAVGMETEVGKIATLLKNTSEHKTPLQENLDRFGKMLSIGIMVLCGILFGLSVFRGEAVGDAFMFAVALAVAAIPEALSTIVTIVLAFGTEKMSKEQAIIRKLQAVEGLGSVSVICSDKTGTLTQNRMTVVEQYAPEDEEGLKVFSVLCSDAYRTETEAIGDPTEVALVDLFEPTEVERIRNLYPRVCEIPFDSERKLMSTVHEYQGRRIMITKGATDVMIDRIAPCDQQSILDKNREFSEKGLRVLAIGWKPVDKPEIGMDDEKDLIFLGLIAMMDPPREESKEAVRKCIDAGIRPVMITGDHKITASAIAREIGILREGQLAVEGQEIENLSKEELMDLVEDVSVYARVSPEHKIRIVDAWQEKGNIVAMTGDGVNDAPALKQADVGVAMGITGTEVSKDAAAMVLADDNFATIVKAIENGRNVYENIKKAIQFLLSGNAAGILAVLYASIIGLGVPFAAVHLLFINLLTDSLPAIALGLDPHSKEVMKRPPRPKDENILTKNFCVGIAVEGVIIGVATIAAYYIGLKTSYSTAMTMAFATLCLGRLFHGFTSKSSKPVLFRKEMFNNKYLCGAFLLGVLLMDLVLLVPGLHGLLKVTTLTNVNFAFVHLFALAAMVVIDLVKWIIQMVSKHLSSNE